MREHGLYWPLGLSTNFTHQKGIAVNCLHSRPEQGFACPSYATLVRLMHFSRSQGGGDYGSIPLKKDAYVCRDHCRSKILLIAPVTFFSYQASKSSLLCDACQGGTMAFLGSKCFKCVGCDRSIPASSRWKTSAGCITKKVRSLEVVAFFPLFMADCELVVLQL